MKVGLVNDYPPSTGIGNYAFSLFSKLVKKGEDVDMLYLQYKEQLDMQDERMKVIETPFKLPILTRTLNWYYYFPKRIPQGYDVYHVSSQYLSKVAKYRKPCVVSCMDIFPAILEKDYPYPLRFMVKRALRYLKDADAVIAISKYSKNLLVDIQDIPEDKVHVVYLGVDMETFKPLPKDGARKKLGLPEDNKIILHVGSEEPRKNMPALINALGALQKKIPEFLFLRVGEELMTTQRLIKKHNLEKKVRYYHNVSTQELSLLYNAADLFVLPSLYEGFGLPALEAMACGTPVVSSNSTALLEVVGDGGRMIDPLDAKALSNGMYDVLTDESLNENIGRKGLARSRNFSWEKTAQETLQVYERVVK